MEDFPTKVLAATDGSQEAGMALRTAASLAAKTNSELHIVHVFPSDVGVPYPAEVLKREPPDQSVQQAQEFLEREVKGIEAEGMAVAGSYLRTGRPANEIVKLSEELGVGVVVIGSRGLGGIRRALMGSVSDSVVRHAPCPVLVVRGREEEVVPLGREDWRPPSEERVDPLGGEDQLPREEREPLGREDQEEAAAVELYQDEAGGLYIFPEGEENGFYLPGGGPGGLFRKHARAIAGGHTEFWRMDLPGATRDAALNIGATHVATWKNDEITVHQRPGSNAGKYLGMS